jgi:prevent-host-death family protein
LNTKFVPLTDLHRQPGAVIRSVQEDGAVVCITRYGRPVAMMVACAQYEALLDRAAQQGWPPGYFESTYGVLASDPIALD